MLFPKAWSREETLSFADKIEKDEDSQVLALCQFHPRGGCSARPLEEMHMVLNAPFPPKRSPTQL